MTFSYLQMQIFLDWLCTIKEDFAMFFDVTFLKTELLKNRINFEHFFHIKHVFLARNLFCYRNQKVHMR